MSRVYGIGITGLIYFNPVQLPSQPCWGLWVRPLTFWHYHTDIDWSGRISTYLDGSWQIWRDLNRSEHSFWHVQIWTFWHLDIWMVSGNMFDMTSEGTSLDKIQTGALQCRPLSVWFLFRTSGNLTFSQSSRLDYSSVPVSVAGRRRLNHSACYNETIVCYDGDGWQRASNEFSLWFLTGFTHYSIVPSWS